MIQKKYLELWIQTIKITDNKMCLLILDCPQSVQTSLSSITDRALCTVSSSCTNLQCCVNIPLLNRTFEVGMELDYSYMSLRVYVEKMTRKQSLIGYQFGREETLSVHGVFKLRFDIVGIEG